MPNTAWEENEVHDLPFAVGPEHHDAELFGAYIMGVGPFGEGAWEEVLPTP